jgi:hypothetical protein
MGEGRFNVLINVGKFFKKLSILVMMLNVYWLGSLSASLNLVIYIFKPYPILILVHFFTFTNF